MSRVVTGESPLTDDERAYLAQRDQFDLIRSIDEKHGVETADVQAGRTGANVETWGVSGTEPSLGSDRTQPSGVGSAQAKVQEDAPGDPNLVDDDDEEEETDGLVRETDEDPYEDWSKRDLVAQLERRELSRSGNKDELIDRLRDDDETRWSD